MAIINNINFKEKHLELVIYITIYKNIAYTTLYIVFQFKILDFDITPLILNFDINLYRKNLFVKQ